MIAAPPVETQEAEAAMGTSTELDVVLLLMVLGLLALLALAGHVARELHPDLPTLPDEDCPPPGLGRLVPVGGQVDEEIRTGVAALEMWLATRRVRP